MEKGIHDYPLIVTPSGYRSIPGSRCMKSDGPRQEIPSLVDFSELMVIRSVIRGMELSNAKTASFEQMLIAFLEVNR